MQARLLLVTLLALPLLACVKAGPAPEPEQEFQAEPCPFVYVFAPGNYIVDIASGSQVVLDPGVQEFELFCSPGAARTAINEGMERVRCPKVTGASTGWTAHWKIWPRKIRISVIRSSAWLRWWTG